MKEGKIVLGIIVVSILAIIFLSVSNISASPFGYDSDESLTITTNVFQGNLTNLSQLTDTNIPSPSDNDVLTFDSASGKWVDEVASAVGDTNETTRFNALTTTDCTAGNLVIGVQSNGIVLCATDSDTDTWAGNSTNYANFSVVNSSIGYYNDTMNTWVDLLFVRFTELVSQVGNWTADKSSYATFSLTNTTIGIYNDSMKDYVDSVAADTNETTRFNTLVATDCSAGSLVIGVDADGTVNCVIDSTTNSSYLLNTGDTATGNYTFDSGTLFVDAVSNKVGIGTINPDSLLHLNATGANVFTLTAGASSLAQIQFGDDADTNAGRIDFDNSDNSLNFLTTDTLHLQITDAGTADFQANNIVTTATGFFSNLRVASVDDSVSTANSGINFGGASKFINFETDATERMRIISDGKIGINTTSPEELLNVFGADVSIMVEGDGVTQAGFKIKTNNVLRWFINSLSAQTRLSFMNTSLSEVFTILQSGNVGIGITDPTVSLDIVGSDSAPGDNTGIFKIRNQSSQPYIQLQMGVNSTGEYVWIESTEIGTSNNRDIILNSLGGNVGIRTTDPQNTLNVVGDGNVTGNFFVGGGLEVLGALTGGGSGHDQFSDFVANEHIDWTSTSSNFLTTGTLGSGKINVTGASAQIDLDGSGGLTEILSGATLEIRQSRDTSAPIIDFRGLPLDTSSTAQFRFGLSSGSSGNNEITLIAPGSTTIASSIGTGFIDFNRNQADTNFRISSVNNLNMFFLDASTDRVGINKLSPAQTLDIVGSFAVSGTASTGALTTTGQATFSGNVGINTTTPQNLFNVVGEGNFTGNVTFGDCIIFSNGGQICQT